MEPVTLLPFRPDGWTIEDLDDLPDDNLRYELVDGSLHVSPPPPNSHNVVANRLSFLLHAVLEGSWEIVAPGAVRFDDRNCGKAPPPRTPARASRTSGASSARPSRCS